MEFVCELDILPETHNPFVQVPFTVRDALLKVFLSQFLVDIGHNIALSVISVFVKASLEYTWTTVKLVILNLRLQQLISYRVP